MNRAVVNKEYDLKIHCMCMLHICTCMLLFFESCKKIVESLKIFCCHEKCTLNFKEVLHFCIETSTWMIWWHIYVRKWKSSERLLSKLQIYIYCTHICIIWSLPSISTNCSIPQAASLTDFTLDSGFSCLDLSHGWGHFIVSLYKASYPFCYHAAML